MVLYGRLQPWRRLLRWGASLVVSGLMSVTPLQAREAVGAAVALTQLPVEAQSVYRQVVAGGPHAYPKDGIVFANRERRLPVEARGVYREYTVATPGLSHRGARRIVCGGHAIAAPQACYYTADHYNSFRRIVD